MIFIALGSNLPSTHGDSVQTLLAAKDSLCSEGFEVLSASRIFNTKPVPVSDQNWYKNAVVSVKTELDPYTVLRTLQNIEASFGVKPTVRNGERVLDLDLLCYNDRVISDAYMVLPHARMHERAFVLYPLLDIAPEWIHPVLGKTALELSKNVSVDQVAEPMELKAA